MGSKIYPEMHENPKVFFSSSSPIFLESSIQFHWGGRIASEWLSQQVFNFPSLLKAEGLSKLVQKKITFYPELVKVFYTRARADLEGNLFSTVNGVNMVIDVVVWKEVVGLDMGGVRKFDEMLDGYNKM